MFIETSLGKVYYTDTGEGTPVVLIHGFGCSHVQWMFTASAVVDAGYRCIGVDLPGFGLSDVPKHPITTDRYSGVLEEVISKLDLVQPILVGSSMGGFVAWLCASRLGARIRGIVLANTAGAPQMSTLPPRNKRRRRPPLGAVTMPGLGAIFGTKLTSPLTRLLVRPIIEKSFGEKARLSPEVFEALHEAAKNARIVFKNRLRFSTVTDPGLELRKINCPTLIVWGDKDAIVPIAAMDFFVDNIPQAKLKVYFGVGHLPMLEAPEEFNADLISFLGTAGLTNPIDHTGVNSQMPR